MVSIANCVKGFAHSKAEDYFTERFFFVLVAFLFGHHEIVAFFGFCCWKTDYSPRIGKLWLSCTLVYEFQDLMEAFGGKKGFYKSESLGKNEVAESSPNDISVAKGPQTANEVAIAWLC